MTFDAFDPIHSQPREFDLSQPCCFVIDTHAPNLPPIPANSRNQPNTNNAQPASGSLRLRRHVCNIAPCKDATFGRGPELRRHHASVHDAHNARYWCPIDGCDRSKMEGGRGFPRKDKMIDHLMRVHGDRVGSAA